MAMFSIANQHVRGIQEVQEIVQRPQQYILLRPLLQSSTTAESTNSFRPVLKGRWRRSLVGNLPDSRSPPSAVELIIIARGKTEGVGSVLVVPMASPGEGGLVRVAIGQSVLRALGLEGGNGRTDARGLDGQPISIFPTLHVFRDAGHALRGKGDSVIGTVKRLGIPSSFAHAI